MDILNQFSKIVIAQVGCGGTGSWLVPFVSKLANNIKLRTVSDDFINYTIFDDDIVEQRNILRQNFSSWDIGKNKALALVSKNVFEFQDIVAGIKRVKKYVDILPDNLPAVDQLPTLFIILGCCDNNKARQDLFKISKLISKKIKSSVVYIDSGNLLYNGQIITKAFNFPQDNQQDLFKKKREKKSKINFKKMFPIESDNSNIPQQSCAFFGDQSQAINIMAATLMFINLQKVLISLELPPEVITFNSSGYSTFEL
jgi:tRNA A37 threonylcarbamoyladenosine dehydratase